MDPDPVTGLYISTTCEKTGSFSIHTAESGEAALVWLFTNPVDVIVSDSLLPKMTGIELLRLLREQNILVPFIFFTSDESASLKNEAYRYDAFGFVARQGTEKKPYLKLIRLMYWAAGYHDPQE